MEDKFGVFKPVDHNFRMFTKVLLKSAVNYPTISTGEMNQT